MSDCDECRKIQTMTAVEFAAYRKLKASRNLKYIRASVSEIQALNRLVKKGLAIKTDSGWRLRVDEVFQVNNDRLKGFVLIPKDIYPLSLGPFETDEFEIGRYPVTNQWFNEFVAADGYKKSIYWSSYGDIWLKNEGIETPRFWKKEEWNFPDAPVVGIAWHEALAFTKWLNQTRKDDYRYSLPDENQWEAAASGMEKWEYPWGNGWAEDRCNSRESGILKNTQVGIFPKGDTPDGISDLAGNVWEWTQSNYHSRNPLRECSYNEFPALRGGSWFYNHEIARCESRAGSHPGYRSINVGFRCVRTKI